MLSHLICHYMAKPLLSSLPVLAVTQALIAVALSYEAREGSRGSSRSQTSSQTSASTAAWQVDVWPPRLHPGPTVAVRRSVIPVPPERRPAEDQGGPGERELV